MNLKKEYKAIFFDLDGTLRHSVPNPGDVSTAKARELGLDISDELAREVADWEHYYWANSDELREDAEVYTNNEGGFWQNYTERRLKALKANPSQIKELTAPLRKYMRKKYRSENWVPPEIHNVLPILSEAGFKLGVLSNRTEVFIDLMEELKLKQYFNFIKAAGEIGSWKPNPAVFNPLFEHYNLAPEETIYIGDNYYADVVGARAAGMKPILYDPRDIFPEPDCIRITSFTELLDIL